MFHLPDIANAMNSATMQFSWIQMKLYELYKISWSIPTLLSKPTDIFEGLYPWFMNIVEVFTDVWQICVLQVTAPEFPNDNYKKLFTFLSWS